MYEIYLIDSNTGEQAKLDVEGVVFTTDFSIADVQDISKRNGDMTRTMNFKGTKDNEKAFGNLFHLNRFHDELNPSKIGPNYSPQVGIDCVIYEGGLPLLKGSMRVIKAGKDRFGVTTYTAVVTGSFVDFKLALTDKLLTDLDVSDLEHQYTETTIKNSWDTSTQRKDGSGFTTVPFEMGSGYVYPHIDYGVRFRDNAYNGNYNNFNVLNYRPALFLKEYFDRIFSEAGFTYEIKGNPSTVDRFEREIVPNNTDVFVTRDSSQNFLFATNGAQSNTFPSAPAKADSTSDPEYYEHPLAFGLVTGNSTFGTLTDYYGSYRGLSNALQRVKRDFSCDGRVSVNFSSIHYNYNSGPTGPLRITIQLVRRGAIDQSSPAFDDNSAVTGWTEIASNFVDISDLQTISPTIEFNTGKLDFKQGDQFMVRLLATNWPQSNTNPSNHLVNGFWLTWTISDAEMSLPASFLSGSVTFNNQIGDEVRPQIPEGVKQFDFVKSVITLFNFYCYPDKGNQKHFIFESYDDYYEFANQALLKTVALDWTRKVDHNKGIEGSSNLEIPKKYLFTFKEDSDYFNKDYKEVQSNNEIFGSFQFTDAMGIVDTKKVEVIFSPTPLVEYDGTGRKHPAIYGDSLTTPKPVKSNIRILFYNGLKQCTAYQIVTETFDGSTWSTSASSSIASYPQCGNYLFDDGPTNVTPLADLHFGRPRHLYFQDRNGLFTQAPTGYDDYYIGQVTDLTDLNMTFLDAEMYLNEIDISNLDLKVPVFLDLGKDGHGYFKVLKVEYITNTETAKVSLQKIPVRGVTGFGAD